MTKLPDEAIEKATKQYAWSGRMSDALKAAYPAIEKQIRAEIAAEIRVEMRRHDTAQIGFSAIGDAYAHAARIAEGVDHA